MTKMQKVANDLRAIKFKDSDTLGSCKDKFNRIMRKHKIKSTSKINSNSFNESSEWIMCLMRFMQILNDDMKLQIMLNGLKEK